MNTTIVFTVKNRHITSDTKSIDLIGDNMDYTAVFEFDEDMASERIKTARFIKDDEQQERILDDNNSCQIPPELLKKGYISVGIYTDEKSTTPCFLKINGSIREKDYSVKDPEPDVYRQLLDKIEKLKGLREIELRADEKNIQWRYVGEDEWKELISLSEISGEVSPEKIKQVVEDYLKANPIKETDPTVPDWAKEPQKPTYTAEEVGALPADTLPEAIDTALTQAKESGMFDGKDGKDGAPGEKGDPGPKGDPGETTYIENPYDDTELKNDIGQLKEDKLTKPADPPTIGKILRVKSVNEDGTFVCEWADCGSDLDVQIDGKSIVQNGVAEIPLCTKTKGAGLITIDTYPNNGGLYKANESTGLIRVMCANERNISARNNAFTPIVPSNFDYTVKAAMCDGKGAAWTADEQASARKRMGALDTQDMIDITEITMDAETLKYVFPSFADYRILEISFLKTYKATTGLTGVIWLRIANNVGWSLNPSYAYNTFTLDASGKSCLGKSIFTNNTQIETNIQGLTVDKKYWNTEFREAPYLILPNAEWAQYYTECNTIIKVRGIQR